MYAKYGSSEGYKSIDSDVFYILLHYAAQLDVNLFFDTGRGNSRRLLNMTDIAQDYGKTTSTALMVIHAFTGCDTTSAFKGIGKVKPVKILESKEHFQEAFVCV